MTDTKQSPKQLHFVQFEVVRANDAYEHTIYALDDEMVLWVRLCHEETFRKVPMIGVDE